MMQTVNETAPVSGGKGWNIGLWAAQIVLALAFGLFGTMKATQPLAQLAVLMKWVPTLPPLFVRTLGVLEVLGAIGLILPSLTKIMPRLTVLAAICFLVLQILAVSLHVSRGEENVLGLNVVLIALDLFILWGRTRKSVIQPR